LLQSLKGMDRRKLWYWRVAWFRSWWCIM